eukprot:6208958-Pleurochrysis_carterae.AAC.3
MIAATTAVAAAIAGAQGLKSSQLNCACEELAENSSLRVRLRELGCVCPNMSSSRSTRLWAFYMCMGILDAKMTNHYVGTTLNELLHCRPRIEPDIEKTDERKASEAQEGGLLCERRVVCRQSEALRITKSRLGYASSSHRHDSARPSRDPQALVNILHAWITCPRPESQLSGVQVSVYRERAPLSQSDAQRGHCREGRAQAQNETCRAPPAHCRPLRAYTRAPLRPRRPTRPPPTRPSLVPSPSCLSASQIVAPRVLVSAHCSSPFSLLVSLLLPPPSPPFFHLPLSLADPPSTISQTPRSARLLVLPLRLCLLLSPPLCLTLPSLFPSPLTLNLLPPPGCLSAHLLCLRGKSKFSPPFALLDCLHQPSELPECPSKPSTLLKSLPAAGGRTLVAANDDDEEYDLGESGADLGAEMGCGHGARHADGDDGDVDGYSDPVIKEHENAHGDAHENAYEHAHDGAESGRAAEDVPPLRVERF